MNTFVAGNIFGRKLVFVLGVYYLFEFVEACHVSIVYIHIRGRRSCLGYFSDRPLVSFLLFHLSYLAACIFKEIVNDIKKIVFTSF